MANEAQIVKQAATSRDSTPRADESCGTGRPAARAMSEVVVGLAAILLAGYAIVQARQSATDGKGLARGARASLVLSFDVYWMSGFPVRISSRSTT